MRSRTDAINRLHRMLLRGSPVRRDAAQVVDDLAAYVLQCVRHVKDTTEIGPGADVEEALQRIESELRDHDPLETAYGIQRAIERVIEEIRRGA